MSKIGGHIWFVPKDLNLYISIRYRAIVAVGPVYQNDFAYFAETSINCIIFVPLGYNAKACGLAALIAAIA